MTTQLISREEVIKLATTMPLEKLASWYEYGLFILAKPNHVVTTEAIENAEALTSEIASWEAASDEDWLNIETALSESK